MIPKLSVCIFLVMLGGFKKINLTFDSWKVEWAMHSTRPKMSAIFHISIFKDFSQGSQISDASMIPLYFVLHTERRRSSVAKTTLDEWTIFRLRVAAVCVGLYQKSERSFNSPFYRLYKDRPFSTNDPLRPVRQKSRDLLTLYNLWLVKVKVDVWDEGSNQLQ